MLFFAGWSRPVCLSARFPETRLLLLTAGKQPLSFIYLATFIQGIFIKCLLCIRHWAKQPLSFIHLATFIQQIFIKCPLCTAGCSGELDRHHSFLPGGEPWRCKEIPAQRPQECLLRTYSCARDGRIPSRRPPNNSMRRY